MLPVELAEADHHLKAGEEFIGHLQTGTSEYERAAIR